MVKPIAQTKVYGLLKWLDKEMGKNAMVSGDWTALVLDISHCPVSLSYLRQILRSNGYATKLQKNSRWLYAYKTTNRG